ncbi:hypothetical protein PMG71_20330 [Roseofilum sp. BLCC_M154]|uniref:Uncharacterized protein n=1 Tax=Roseofilum acuticapitatum BLCC-M154 TaxID=3022444 RepID=A0ABT7AXZ1_9CYAN|nr:hypothetical protein [Roseofilum acuticapitatum]MDJ1171780.1 hypothetical protein [Roseofilum acuticapitatum BLCC-M154]
MQANLNSTLVELKQHIEDLPVGDRWALLKWLVELLQQNPLSAEEEKTKINLEAVHYICDRIRNLPVLDSRSTDEIIGYNQFGGLD